MASITPDSFDTGRVLGQRGDSANVHNGRMHFRFPFVTNTVSDGDTFNTGLAYLNALAWTPLNNGDEVTAGRDGSVASFSAAAGSHNGYLHVWASQNSSDDPGSGNITPDAYTSDEVLRSRSLHGAVPLEGCQLRIYPFTTSGAGADVWSSPLTDIVEVGWSSSDGTTPCCVTRVTSSIVAFTYSSGTPQGVLCVWTRGR